MAEKRQLEFFLLRYVPDAVREEFVNIGVVAVEGDGGFADVRFTHDWRRVRCLDPEADVEMLEALERDIRGEIAQLGDRELLIKKLQDSFSNLLQLSPTKGCLAEDPVQEMGVLESLYLETRWAGKRALSGRMVIHQAMTDAFAKENVLGSLMKSVTVAPYTWPNDPVKIDFAYRVGGFLKMVQPMPTRSSTDATLGIAFRYPKIKDAMRRMEQADAMLTGVVEDDASPNDPSSAFAFQVMQESGIRIVPVGQMPEVAAEARRDMGL